MKNDNIDIKKIMITDLIIILSSILLSFILKAPLKKNAYDVLSAIGLIVVVIGCLGFIKAIPKKTDDNDDDDDDDNPDDSSSSMYSTHGAIESIKESKGISGSQEKHKKRYIFSFNWTSLNIIICGIIIIIISIIEIQLGMA